MPNPNMTETVVGEDTIFTGPCFSCNGEVAITAPTEAVRLWRSGLYIQDALRMLDDGQREFLISGTCNACFDALFADMPGDDEDGEPVFETPDPAATDGISDPPENDDPMGLRD